MKKVKIILIVVNLIFLIGYFNWSIYAKEKVLDKGELVLLELAPVDPRSIMQGDYMLLNYKESILPEGRKKVAKRGFCILKLDKNGVGHSIAIRKDIPVLEKDHVAIKYFLDGNRYWPSMHIGSGSYFFQEGKGKKYEAARYGALKIDRVGNSVLIGLYDKDFKMIL